MTARELRVGDRVTIGKGRTRYTIVVIVRGVVEYYDADFEAEAQAVYNRAAVAVLVRNARSYWRGKAVGRGRRVPLAKISRVKR